MLNIKERVKGIAPEKTLKARVKNAITLILGKNVL